MPPVGNHLVENTYARGHMRSGNFGGLAAWARRTQRLRVETFGERLAPHEEASRDHTFTRRDDIRPERETSVHVRGHDETQARGRTAAVARWQVGRVRLRRCRSRKEHEDFAFVDCAGERR